MIQFAFLLTTLLFLIGCHKGISFQQNMQGQNTTFEENTDWHWYNNSIKENILNQPRNFMVVSPEGDYYSHWLVQHGTINDIKALYGHAMVPYITTIHYLLPFIPEQMIEVGFLIAQFAESPNASYLNLENKGGYRLLDLLRKRENFGIKEPPKSIGKELSLAWERLMGDGNVPPTREERNEKQREQLCIELFQSGARHSKKLIEKEIKTQYRVRGVNEIVSSGCWGEKKSTPLHKAAQSKDYSNLLILLSDKYIDVDPINEEGDTPLLLTQDCRFQKLLLGAGANINHQNPNGFNLVHQHLFGAKCSQSPINREYILFLVKNGFDIHLKSQGNEFTFFNKSPLQGVLCFLRAHPLVEDMLTYDQYRDSKEYAICLFYVVRTHKIKLMKLFLKYKIDWNVTNNQDQTIITYAEQMGSSEEMKNLLRESRFSQLVAID